MNGRLRYLDLGGGLGVLFLLLWLWLWQLAQRPPTDFDDAYMVLRYVEHVLAGQGLVWNTGEPPVYGITSRLQFAWILLLRLTLSWLSPAELLRVASGSAAVAHVAALVALSVLFARQRSWLLWTLALIPAFAFTEAFQFHGGTGMDTQLAALANTGVVFAALQLGRRPSWRAVGVAAFTSTLAYLARPENALPALLSPALALVLLAPRPHGKYLGAFLGMTLGLWGLDLLLCNHFLGSPVPLAFFAKRPGYYQAFAGEMGWNPYWFLRVFWNSTWPAWVALMAFMGRAHLRQTLVLLLPIGLTMGGLFYFRQIMGHLGRFYFPFLPFVVLAGVLAFSDGITHLKSMLRSPMILRLALAGLAVYIMSEGLLAAGTLHAQQVRPDDSIASRTSSSRLPEMDSWTAAGWIARLAIAAPVGSSFAMSEYGLPGALAPKVAILDLLGLHDTDVARHGFSADVLFRRAPDVIWLPHPDHQGMLSAILNHPEFKQGFLYFPDAFTYGLALRKNSLHFSAIQAALGRIWAEAYPGILREPLGVWSR